MSDETSPRLREFQEHVDELKLHGGGANPERTAVRLSIVLFVVAVVMEVVAYSGSRNTSSSLEQNDFLILAILGVVVALGAVALFVRASMTRYLRYWLVRLIYEDRAGTDRIVEAIEESN
ncbi:MAG: hypothetical protein R8F63_13470 [Acidimicrobiales bacterium]|nr:hypothetical protein [Acidimicrobiales bacterium]